MALVGFAPTADFRDDPSKYEILRVTDGDPATTSREWFIDTEHLAVHGVIVLNTDTDGPIIAALDKYAGFERCEHNERVRTLPERLEDMNSAQLLATEAGNAIKGNYVKDDDPASGLVQDLPADKLRARIKKAEKGGLDAEDADYPGDRIGADDAIKEAKKGGTEEGVTVYETGLLSPAHVSETGPAPETSAANPYGDESTAPTDAGQSAGARKNKDSK